SSRNGMPPDIQIAGIGIQFCERTVMEKHAVYAEQGERSVRVIVVVAVPSGVAAPVEQATNSPLHHR
ncbi:MAG: hypothetical protein FD188_3356, partial [Ignavibacteria bacterium]